MREQEKGHYLSISVTTFRRLPQYYHYLKLLREKGEETVSSPAIARDLRLNEVQVRKDLAAVSPSGGRPRTGYRVRELLHSLDKCLGYDNVNDAVLVGCGRLGSALLSYEGFSSMGLHIVAAFDRDGSLTGRELFGKPVFPVEKLPGLCRRMGVHLGIIAVPAPEAQEVCDLLVDSGVLAVWNFAPVHLSAAEGILVHNENMALSLALLSQHLQEAMAGEAHRKEGSPV